MEELKKIFADYDLPMVIKLKESIDFTLSVVDTSIEVDDIQPLLLFNAFLSEIIKEVTLQMEDENRVLEVILYELQEQKKRKKDKKKKN